MNVLADTYIPDPEKLARFRYKLCGAWTLSCIERRLGDEADAATPAT